MRTSLLCFVCTALVFVAQGCSDDSGVSPDSSSGADGFTPADAGVDWPTSDTGGTADQFVWPDRGTDGPPATEVTIPDIKNGTVAEGTLVVLKDVVVSAVDDFGQYTGDVYVQEAGGGASSGVLLYKPTRLDAGAISDLKPGDHVQVVGTVKHYAPSSGWNDPLHPNKTVVKELVEARVTFLNAGAAPTPTVVAPADIINDPTAEGWENVVVRVEDVRVTAPANSYGEITVTGGLKVDDELYAHAATGGDCLTVTGVVAYFYGYKLNPRSAADVQSSTGCAAPSTVKISDIQDPSSANHPAEGTQVTVTGVITAVDTSKDGGGNYSGFFIQDPAGGQYSGIYVYSKFDDSSTTKPVQGDLVELTGTYQEYPSGSADSVSELSSATWVSKGSGTIPAPVAVAAADVANGGSQSEAYEGVLIEVSGIEVGTVVQDSAGKNVSFEDKSTALQVDHMLFDAFLNPTPPAVGTVYSKVVGPLHYSYGAFRIAPRSAADLVQ